MTSGVDANLSAFLSDIHVGVPDMPTQWGAQPSHQNALFDQTIEKVLSMNPRPARVVIFGDIALWFGYEQDYALSRPRIDRLTRAGIDVILTTGNHDHRGPMSKFYPEQMARSPVAGRFVSVVNLGYADLLLLDTLDDNLDGEGTKNNGGGVLDETQRNWLVSEAARRSRPFFVGAHQHPREISGENLIHELSSFDRFCGFIHGHDHVWTKTWLRPRNNRRIRRIVGLPSTGWWGDIGFVTMRTFVDHADLTLHQDDFFCNRPLNSDCPKPQDWVSIVRENQGQVASLGYY